MRPPGRPPVVTPRRPSRLGRWLIALAVAALALLALRAHLAERRGAHELLGAQWIWAPGYDAADQPAAFYAVRDFELDFTPERARLLTQADEEYLLLVNGSLIGGNRYVAGAPLDAYEIAGELRRGPNRLLVELRSSRGVGGLLVCLEISGEGRSAVVVSDGDWSIRWWEEAGLVDPAHRLEPLDTKPVWVWGGPPKGRWGLPAPGDPRPLFATVRTGRRPEQPVRTLAGRGEDGWQAARGPRRAASDFGQWSTFDWGRPMTGYLGLRFAGGSPGRGVVYLGDEPPRPGAARPDLYVVVMPGRTAWSDSAPRRFRYATVVTTRPLVAAYVVTVDAELAAPLMADGEPPAGVFGIVPPELKTPMENEVWRQLEGVASVPGGEEP